MTGQANEFRFYLKTTVAIKELIHRTQNIHNLCFKIGGGKPLCLKVGSDLNGA